MDLLELLALEISTLLLQYNSRRQGNDLYHPLDPYISNTKLLHAPQVELLYLSSNFGTLGKDSTIPRESAELPKQHLEFVSHSISSQSSGLPPGSQSVVVIKKPFNEARAKPKTIHGAFHP